MAYRLPYRLDGKTTQRAGALGSVWGEIRAVPLAFALVVAVLVAKQVVWVAILEPGLFAERAGAVLFAVTTGLTLLLASAAFLFGGRLQIGLLLLLNLFVTAVGYADIVHFRQFHDLSSVATLRYASQAGAVGSSVLALMNWSDLWMWADVGLLGLLLVLPGVGRVPALGKRLLGGSVVAGVALVTVGCVASPRLEAGEGGNAYLAGDLGIVGYHLVDASQYALQRLRTHTPTPAEVEGARAYLHEREETLKGGRGPLHGVAEGKNLIVIQLESFQDFVLEQEVGGVPVAPNLRALAAESVRFSRFFSQSGKGSTADAEFAVACSLLPLREGAVFFEFPAASYRCLPDSLRGAGYATHVFHANRPDFWNRETIYPLFGYDRYHSSLDYEIDEVMGMGLSDDSFFQQTAAKLEELPQPFYAFINSLTSHHPFDYPDIPSLIDVDGVEGRLVRGYLRAIRYTDYALGRLIETLRERGILDESVLVVYGDHAGLKRTNSRLGELLPIPEGDLFQWAQVERQVPLLIRFPDAAEVGVREEVAGQIDLAPTLLQLLGVEEGGALFLGRDLFGEGGAAQSIFYNGSAISETRLYLSHDDGAGRPRCLTRAGEVPLGECESLRSDAKHWTGFSRAILEKDLVTVIE